MEKMAIRGIFETKASAGPPGKGWNARPPSAWLFLAVFFGVVLSFVGSTAYSRHIEHAIHDDAIAIAGNAAPSVEHLGKARTELRHVDTLVQSWLLTGDRAELGEIARARARFRAEIDAYLALPTFPDEHEIWLRVSQDIRSVDDLVDRVLLRAEHGDARGAADLGRTELTATVNRASEAIGRSIEFDAGQTRRLAESIEATRRRSVVVVGVLDTLSGVLAIAAGCLLFRAVRRHAALIAAHERLTQARADEGRTRASRASASGSPPCCASSRRTAARSAWSPRRGGGACSGSTCPNRCSTRTTAWSRVTPPSRDRAGPSRKLARPAVP
jgi:CHASE3 domain sensor protein